jgi:hypothetical protein
MSIRESLKTASFIVIFIGTVGLLLNELILDWGRTATIAFAATNLVGLAALVWSMKKAREQ